ncbi:FAD-binding and (Fe-S)-binding domain-containing protein [Paenarthrobacter sp. RAF54_2]|uniref:FAD-binding and (Fe-S)-binding domain-containing protein n=1 Tax=Paenarthrobacter sp. RAF54_2 TaxID=3233061 RepID=UPI003F96DECC
MQGNKKARETHRLTEIMRAFQQDQIEASTRASDRLAMAHDASHYLLTPAVVVTPANVEQVAKVFAQATAHVAQITFRSGGTSLSGQAGTDSLLLDTRQKFRQVSVLDDGARVTAGAGMTVRQVNQRLMRHGRKLGPDPASEIACTIGGVVANNSSGMLCGISENTYRTLDSLVMVLPSGLVIDTAQPDADDTLRTEAWDVHAGLGRIRDRIRSDPSMIEQVRALYSIKNTMGYGLNSFLDHTKPIDILEHLLVGSEGTLAFVAESTFTTVPVKSHVATSLLLFKNLSEATLALPSLVQAGFAAIELMDATSLRVGKGDPQAPDVLVELDVADHAAFLVELQEETAEQLEKRMSEVSTLLGSLALVHPPSLSTEPVARARLWRLRKGLYTLVAGNRPSGTTALLEDVAVPVGRLYETCTELIRLFECYGYEQSVIFGHAKDGNIHFMLNEHFDDPECVKRYRAFTEDLVALILAQGGTLKAEHGTGRMMAPYVRRQFGDALYEIMVEIKRLVDPKGILNPGVLLSEDPESHVRNVKSAPAVEAEVDKCVSCGYCEPVCPSKDLTRTPRQRIMLRREIRRAQLADNASLVQELERDFRYEGVETCAADGMCEVACPLLINTGDLVRRLRAEQANPVQSAIWEQASGHWDGITRIAGTALSVASKVPSKIPAAATRVGRLLAKHDDMPLYDEGLPAGGGRRPALSSTSPAAVYFSSCTATMFGPEKGIGVAESFVQLCKRAEVPLITPDRLPSLCCGTPWKSKGMTTGYNSMKKQVVSELGRATNNGQLPVVCDASSCTEGLKILLEATDELDIRVLDSVAFVEEHVLPRLKVNRKLSDITLHPTCSSHRLGLDPALVRTAAAIAQMVVVPDNWGCCAFAGDRGMLHPELTSSATALEAQEVAAHPTAAHASLNRTCELGMTRATGESYRHILELVNEATAP